MGTGLHRFLKVDLKEHKTRRNNLRTPKRPGWWRFRVIVMFFEAITVGRDTSSGLKICKGETLFDSINAEKNLRSVRKLRSKANFDRFFIEAHCACTENKKSLSYSGRNAITACWSRCQLSGTFMFSCLANSCAGEPAMSMIQFCKIPAYWTRYAAFDKHQTSDTKDRKKSFFVWSPTTCNVLLSFEPPLNRALGHSKFTSGLFNSEVSICNCFLFMYAPFCNLKSTSS